MAAVVQPHERKCAVCTNDFTTPKILPCGHLLCQGCVISLISSKLDAGCPLCTCPIVELKGNSPQSAADVAEALPTDSVMKAIVESAGMMGKDNMCTVCDNLKAEYICMQCFEKMCESCKKIHKKMAVSRSHAVESVSTVTPERLAASRPALCADHGDKQAELFCVDHNLVICQSCSKKHSGCKDVKPLDEKMKSAEKILGSLAEELEKAEENLKQAIWNLCARQQRADATKDENMVIVDSTCDRLQSMVEDCRKEMKNQISHSSSKFEAYLSNVKKDLKKRLGKVTSHKHLVTRATTVRPRPALIHAAQTLTDRVNSLDVNNELEVQPWVDPSPEITKHCDDVVRRITAELQSLELQPTGVEATQEPVLVFHENCGRNIRLLNSNTTAEVVKPGRNSDCLVFSRDAMAVNILYEVRIDNINTKGKGCLYLGVTRIPPAQLNLPGLCYDLKESVILWDTDVRVNGDKVKSNVTNALGFCKVGSRFGLMVDSSNNLHFYADGDHQGVAAKDVPRPCFVFFDLFNKVIQVTALPTSRMT
ncbi:E3 ubiquitin-protein ligase TRIM33-like isoform X2 [Pomacea canaliculata]|nr:E3 ubiquitin-protein ligase TRIM33-like isoform X2 [Pomacea canaliculata]XP_025080940.1 E3 ubiquitin-protein ligase TRIM33-like isoform X2 [Pomacea canaliculata]